MRFELDEDQAPGMVPQPMRPPGHPAVPTPPARLPVLPGQVAQLKTMVTDALETKLPQDDLEIVCYLIRRAHGIGCAEARSR